MASLAALVSVVAALLPITAGALDGRWQQPSRDLGDVLSWMPEQAAERGAFRVLWVGDRETLPLDGWRYVEGVAFATSRDGPPDVRARWPGASPGDATLLADVLDLASSGRTTRAGRLLAPMAVRYIVVPSRAAPAEEEAPVRPAPARVVGALGAQIDLKELESDAAVRVYENVAWLPAVALLDDAGSAASQASGLRAGSGVDPGGARPVLEPTRSETRYRGDISSAGTVYLAEASSGRWQLRVAGDSAPRRDAFGWANAFSAGTSGEATLRYRTSPFRWGALLLQLALWFVALRFVVPRLRWRGRRR